VVERRPKGAAGGFGGAGGNHPRYLAPRNSCPKASWVCRALPPPGGGETPIQSIKLLLQQLVGGKTNQSNVTLPFQRSWNQNIASVCVGVNAVACELLSLHASPGLGWALLIATTACALTRAKQPPDRLFRCCDGVACHERSICVPSFHFLFPRCHHLISLRPRLTHAGAEPLCGHCWPAPWWQWCC